ncbi:hypothetical protein ACFWQL_33250 [Amycolatopsis thermoflava]
MNRIALAALLVLLVSCWYTGDIPGKMRTTAQNALTTLTALLPTAASRA